MMKLQLDCLDEYQKVVEAYDDAQRILGSDDDLVEAYGVPVKPDNAGGLKEILAVFDANPIGIELLKEDTRFDYAGLRQRISEVVRSCLEDVLLDSLTVDDKKRNQEEWFGYWNDINDGRVMASMGDFYLAFKQLRYLVEEGRMHDKFKAQIIVDGLRQDVNWPWRKSWLVSGTLFIYSQDDLRAAIIQHYGCKKSDLVKEKKPVVELEVPVYWENNIEEVVSDEKGLNYLQALFDTDDNSEEIVRNLEFISGKSRDKILVWTADTSGSYTRNDHPLRAAGFISDSEEFCVVCNYDRQGDAGCSRGVRVGGGKQ